VTLQIVAHVNPTPENVEQYGLFVDGHSFKTLPILPQLLEWYSTVAAVADAQTNPDERDAKSVPADKENLLNETSDEALPEREQQQQRRLSRAGLDVGQISLEEFDELRSSLNEVLERLREALADAIPVTEEKQILSRAIVNILSQDDLDSDSSHEDSLSVDFESKLDPTETEADLLYETIEWLMANTQRRDFDLAKLDFLEKEIESVVCHVRCDRLDPYDASRAVIPVAALLGFELKQPFKRHTVVLNGLDSKTTTHDVIRTMAQFGELDVAAVSRSYAGFGKFARFGLRSLADLFDALAHHNFAAAQQRFVDTHPSPPPFPLVRHGWKTRSALTEPSPRCTNYCLRHFLSPAMSPQGRTLS
jgi:hypothetical protein